MKRIWKKLLNAAMMLLIIIGGILIAINTYFDDDIEKNIVNQIQKNLEQPLILDGIEFSLYNNFPYASLKIKNLMILESEGFNLDTLLFTPCAYVEVSMLDLINKKYDIQSIIVTDAKISIKYNDLQNPNFLIFKKKSKNNPSFSIREITLLNTQLKIQKKIPQIDLNWFVKRSIIAIDNQKYTFNTNGFSDKLVVGTTDYMNKKQFDFHAKTIIKKNNLSILTSNLNLENLSLIVQGDISKGNILDLNVNGKNQEIKQVIINLPQNIQKLCSGFITTGKITFDSSLKGLINKENNPSFEMKYEVSKGNFKLTSNPFELDNIELNGSITNGEARNFNSTRIDADLFKAKTPGGEINGNFTLTNLNNYFLNGQFKSSWSLANINKYFKDSQFVGLTGQLFASTRYTGNISFNNRFKRMFLNAEHNSDIQLENVTFNHTISPLNFTLKEVKCKLKGHTLAVSLCKSTVSETDLNFNGTITNLIPHILNEASKIYISGNINSTYTNLSELITIGNNYQEDSKNEKGIMPNWLETKTVMEIENLSYKKFIASNITGNISYKNKTLHSKKLDANSLNGNVSCEFSLNEPINNNLKLESRIKLTQINIRNSFDAFNNYGQKFINQEQLKGVGTAEIEVESYWKPNFLLDTKKLKITSHLIIEKGELIDFKPLEKLSSYVSLDELKHVKFSTLENTIKVQNELITIPKMEVKSSALSVFLSGEHSFNQEINYEITLLLSELLSSSFRNKNTKITEFGEEKKDGEIFNTVYFKMTGNTDEPKITLNKIRFMEDVKNNITKEKDIINNIIKQDILQTEEKKQKESGQDIEIEWDPEL